MSLSFSTVLQRPSISADNKNPTGAVGATVTMHCRTYDASSRPAIRWYREHKPLPINSRIDGEYLQIYNLQLDDAGRYYCEVATTEGIATDHIELTVNGNFYV